MAPPRSRAYPPLFHVLLAFQVGFPRLPKVPGLTVARRELNTGPAKFDLTFTLTEQSQSGDGPGDITGGIEYAADFFDATTVRWLLALVRAAVERPELLAGAAGEAAGLEAERILGVLREGGDVIGAHGDLHRLLRRVGVAAGLNGISRGAGIGGLPAVRGHPVAPPVLVCPVGRCSRAVLLDDPPQVPRECRLHAQRLRRLDSPA